MILSISRLIIGSRSEVRFPASTARFRTGGPLTSIESTFKAANQQTGADVIVVDTEGLTDAQAERVRQVLTDRVATRAPSYTQR